MLFFEVWMNNGIPVTEPEFTSNSVSEVREYLTYRVYMNSITGKIEGGEGEVVYCNDTEIPLDAFFGSNEFYSNEEWEKIHNL